MTFNHRVFFFKPGVESVVGTLGDLNNSAFSQFNTALSRAFLEYPATVNINLLGISENHFVKFKPATFTL